MAVLSLLMTSSLAGNSARAQSSDIEEISVSGDRLPIRSVGQLVVDIDVRDQATFRLDSSLGSVPGVSLFRRANSFTAHPTTQGLGLRGVGANAAGRTLVTLDGIPQNDPFGGWIYWSGYQGVSIANARVRKGGSPGAFGAQALAGAVDLQS